MQIQQPMRNTKGFTLIELMVAISIVAVLATIGLTLFGNAQKTGRDGKRRADIDAIATNLESRFNTTKNQNCGNGTGGIPSGTDAAESTYCPPYATWFAGGSIPVDPLNTGTYTYTNDGGAIPTNATFTTYTICAHLEGTGSGNSTDYSGAQGAGSKDYYCRKNQQS